MQILQTITVKQVLTVKSKEELQRKFAVAKERLVTECEQLKFEQRKLERTKSGSISHIREHFDQELAKRQEKIDLLEFQIEQLHMLPIGSEIKERDIQGLIDVHVGDQWDDIVVDKTIVIEDGIVVKIT